MSDFTFRNDEWELDGAILVADVEITLVPDFFDSEVSGIALYSATYEGHMARVGGWVHPFMLAWVAQNQDRLTQYYYDHCREAA